MKWGSKSLRIIMPLILVTLLILFFTFNTFTPSSSKQVIQERDPKFLDSQAKSLTSQTERTPQLILTDDLASSEFMPEKTSATNGQLMEMKRPNWKLEEPFITHVEGLEIEAAKGDNIARYVLALNLRYCYYSPLDAESLEVKLEEVQGYSDGDTSADRIKEQYEYCAGVEQDQRSQFYTYLESAALDGFVAAQEEVGSITSKFFMQSQGYEKLERDAYIHKRDSFIQQQYELLEQAAKNGSVKALISLSNIHHSQAMGGNSQIKSFAINQLILELTKSNQLYNRYSWFKEKQYKQLSPEQVETAINMSEEWLEIINSNGTLYLSE